MTLNGWLQILVFCGIVILLVKPLGGYMTRVFNGERTLPVARSSVPSSGASIGSPAPASAKSSTGPTYAAAHAAVQPRRLRRALLPAALPGRACPSIPAGMARGRRPSSPSTPPSASSPTPTGRTTAAKAPCPISSQMAGLTVQNFVSAATGIAHRRGADPRLLARVGARRSAISGSI